MDNTHESAEELARIYINIRDIKEQLEQKQREEVEVLKAQMDAVADKMLEICKALGVSSMRTNVGTIIRKTSVVYNTNDWGSLWQFIKEHDAYGLVQQRLHQSNIKQYLEENPGVTPPGMWADSKYVMAVRRNSN